MLHRSEDMLLLQQFPDAPSFLAAAAPFLEARELDHNFLLGLTAGEPGLPPGWMLLVAQRDGVVEAAALLAGERLFLSHAPDKAAPALFARYFLEKDRHPQLLIAPAESAEAFAAHYPTERQGGRASLIVHALHAVSPLPQPAGRLERPEPRHFDLLTAWHHAFHVDAGLTPLPDELIRTQLRRRIEADHFFIWTVDGEPVSMAAMMRATRRIAIVGLVYTPAEHRGQGFATGLVAQLSDVLLARGFSQCGLFTDAANPTSNHIYYKIGYRPGTEFREITYR